MTSESLASRRRQLSPAQLELLRQLEAGHSPGLFVRGIDKRPDPTVTPLSAHQLGICMVTELFDGLYADVPFRNQSVSLRLDGTLDVGALRHGLDLIYARHEGLRAIFPVVDGQRCVRLHGRPAELEIVDIGAGDPAVQVEQARRLGLAAASRPLDLADGPLLKATLFRLAADLHVLHLLIDHILFDGWSFGVLIAELSEHYGALLERRPVRLPELPIQYGDFAHWQMQWLHGPEALAQLGYWREQLGAGVSIVEWPADHPRRDPQPVQLAVHEWAVPRELFQRASAYSRGAGVTLFMTLLAVQHALLARKTGAGDTSIVSPVASRVRPELQGLIGGFSNGVALRADVSDDPPFVALLQRVRASVLGALANQELPFGVVEEQVLSHADVFRCYFALQNFPVPPLRLPGLQLRPYDVNFGATLWDMTIILQESEGALSGPVTYNTELFELATIALLTREYEQLLARALSHPEQRISKL